MARKTILLTIESAHINQLTALALTAPGNGMHFLWRQINVFCAPRLAEFQTLSHFGAC